MRGQRWAGSVRERGRQGERVHRGAGRGVEGCERGHRELRIHNERRDRKS